MTKQIIAVYPYVDEDGELLYEVVRCRDKTFAMRRPDGKGGWIWNLDDVRRVPYRLPELLSRRQNETVFVVEGEKDADNLAALGLCVTTSAQGAGWEWPASWAVFFDGAPLVVPLTDCDVAGRAAVAQRGGIVATVCDEVRPIDLAVERDDGFDVSDWLALGHTREELLTLASDAPRAEAQRPVTVAAVLDEIMAFILCFVVLASAEAAVYLALWVFHTHAIEAADHTPFTIIRSPQKRAGKSRLEEVLRCLVARPWMTSRTTVAALVRKVAKDRCTLLLDETDAAFAGDQAYSESLRAILDAAHTRGALATLCVGQGANMEACDFEVFTAVAIAGIGRLPDTIEDRGVRIGMKRKTKSEKIERFRPRKIKTEADDLRARIARAAATHLEALRASEPPLPDELNDRAQDGWEPLLAIADEAGGDWPKIARDAAKSLSGDRAAEDEDDPNPTGLLLRDIQKAFSSTPCDEEGLSFWEPRWEAAERLHTADLIDRLCRIPGSPWATWRRGDPINPERLAKLLDGYTDANGKQIRSKQIKLKINGKNVNRHGYELADFGDAFARFLSPEAELPATDATGDISQGFSRDSQPATKDSVAGSENANSTDRVTKVAGVAGSTPQFPTNDEQLSFEFAQAPPPYVSRERDALAGRAYNCTDSSIPAEGSSGAPTTLASSEIGGYAEDLFGYAERHIEGKASADAPGEVNDEW